MPDYILHFSSLGAVRVGDVLADLKKFDRQSLADPIEGPDYGKTTATFYANIGKGKGKPFINSFAHGGYTRFFLTSTDSNNSGVTGVTANSGAGSSCNPEDLEGVTGVTNTRLSTDTPPCYRVFDDWELNDGKKIKPGVWYFGVKSNGEGKGPTLTKDWICSPIHIIAVTSDNQDNNFGRLLEFRNTLGRWRKWAMPMELLKGSGEELRGVLLQMGVELDPRNGRNLLPSYLQAFPPKEKIYCAQQIDGLGIRLCCQMP
jgi:hypothetical protein